VVEPARSPEDTPTVESLLAQTRPPKGIHAVAIIDARDLAPRIATTGEAASSEFFELGSLTKTLTATLLAVQVVAGELTLEHTVGSILGPRAGRAANVTLGQLATHTSGLPRLAPNSITIPFWPRDPYRFYGRQRLWAGLDRVELSSAGRFAYSNLGYSLLGECLAQAMGMTFAAGLADEVLRPAQMTTARCQPCPRRGLVRGHGHWLMAGRRWHDRLPGAGGVDGTVLDVAAWATANLEPDSTPLAEAVRLAQQVHHSDAQTAVGLGWVVRDEIRWHNGATGGFQSMLAFDSGRAVAALAAHSVSSSYSLDSPLFRHLETERSR
jgi:serine-type D-Ala-D-Ala carboxypeptidase/endopeptidase